CRAARRAGAVARSRARARAPSPAIRTRRRTGRRRGARRRATAGPAGAPPRRTRPYGSACRPSFRAELARGGARPLDDAEVGVLDRDAAAVVVDELEVVVDLLIDERVD